REVVGADGGEFHGTGPFANVVGGGELAEGGRDHPAGGAGADERVGTAVADDFERVGLREADGDDPDSAAAAHAGAAACGAAIGAGGGCVSAGAGGAFEEGGEGGVCAAVEGNFDAAIQRDCEGNDASTGWAGHPVSGVAAIDGTGRAAGGHGGWDCGNALRRSRLRFNNYLSG